MNNKEKLIEICEKNEWEWEEESGVFTVRPKDIWDGVEFAESLGLSGFTTGKVYKIHDRHKQPTEDEFSIIGDRGTKLTIHHSFFKPSTEQAYVDQLKKEAFERFGEIKDGDEFVRDWNGSFTVHGSLFRLDYEKEYDSLYLRFEDSGYKIYRHGQWATKVSKPEPKKRIYISGKISGLDYLEARAKFGKCYSFLSTHGYEPVNPMIISPYNRNKTWNDYMSECMSVLLTCDAIYIQKDWGQSRGARIERAIALELGLEIIYEE